MCVWSSSHIIHIELSSLGNLTSFYGIAKGKPGLNTSRSHFTKRAFSDN